MTREAFEKWVSSSPRNRTTVTAGAWAGEIQGQYIDQTVELAWEAWQSAIEHERKACANVCEESMARIWDYHDEVVKTTAVNVCTNLAAAIRARSNA